MLLSGFTLFAQVDTLNKKRLTGVVLTGSAMYASSMIGLYHLWYKDYPSSKFHFFNDNKEWLLMDKVGHSLTSYYVGLVGYKALKWSGVNENKSIWYGGSVGLLFLTSVEVYDGFSEQWGASYGDIAANTFGSGMFIAQQKAWGEQRVLLKYSFHQSDYWHYNPKLLGKNTLQQSLKDYNGQTYWLSMNLNSITNIEQTPKWLNLAVGYSADGMVGAFRNNNILPNDIRVRKYYLSLDVDLTRIKTKSKFLKTVLTTVGFIKIPFPAIEFVNNNVNFKPFYF